MIGSCELHRANDHVLCICSCNCMSYEPHVCDLVWPLNCMPYKP